MSGLTPQAVFSAMQTGQPYKSYIKTILGKLYLHVFDPFKNEAIGLILSGNPRNKNNESCIIDTWSEMDDAFLHRMNPKHFAQGTLLEHTRSGTVKVERTIQEFSDEELANVLAQKFGSLQSTINKIEEIPPIYRLLLLAEEMDKSEKILDMIRSKLSELQEKTFTGEPIPSE